MARTRKPVSRFKRPSSSQISEALGNTLDREFEDYVATQSVPAVDDRRGRTRYEASLRRMALGRPDVSVIDPGASGYPRAADEAARRSARQGSHQSREG